MSCKVWPGLTESQRSQRLFFALWPDAQTRARIAKQARVLARRQGRPVAAENLHITLAFIGASGPEQRSCLEAQGTQVRVEPFCLELSRVGYFPRARVLWVGPQTTPESLLGLVVRLNRVLAPCGYRPEPRPFAVHVTLFRKANPVREAPAFEPVPWPVRDFCLVESVSDRNGVHYQVLRRFR